MEFEFIHVSHFWLMPQKIQDLGSSFMSFALSSLVSGLSEWDEMDTRTWFDVSIPMSHLTVRCSLNIQFPILTKIWRYEVIHQVLLNQKQLTENGIRIRHKICWKITSVGVAAAGLARSFNYIAVNPQVVYRAPTLRLGSNSCNKFQNS